MRNRLHVTGTPGLPIHKLVLPEFAVARLLRRLFARVFCEQRKAGLRVLDQLSSLDDGWFMFTSCLIFPTDTK